MAKYKNIFIHKSEALIMYCFLAVILVGALLLKLPISNKGEPLTWIDSLFMATSAVCVTGLSVVDISKELTLFGQIVLLVLIQMGGLGIMTFSLLFLVFLGKEISLRLRLCIPDLSQDINIKNFKYSLFFIIAMTISIEAIGACALFVNLRQYHLLPYAMYSSIFHSVSAFCNAGFSLYSESFTPFNRNLPVLFILMGLIVTGGLGFIVIFNIFDVLNSNRKKQRVFMISLHTRIALIATLCLIFGGAGIIWLLEARGRLANLPLGFQFLNACFLSITARTAGFNTLPTTGLANPTLFILLFLMFVGACPGSTGGGIKVHTFVTLMALLKNKFLGVPGAGIYKRTIPEETLERALTIFILSLLIIFFAVFLLLVTEKFNIPEGPMAGKETFLHILFEAISAFGTVGLSMGMTPVLSPVGKLVLVVLMFVGRVGLLTLGIALQLKNKAQIKYQYPHDDILIG